MNGGDVHEAERRVIMSKLLDSVKNCQIRYGGKSELATETDSSVSDLCAAWESTFQHGMKRISTPLSTLKQMTEKVGLGKVTDLFPDIKNSEMEPVFWLYVKEHLSKDECDRFSKLVLVNTDLGRGKAWLRSSLNEHSLERYTHMLIENDWMLSQHYEDWAFLRDLEKSSMLPNMAAGLGSILFALTVDRPELNQGHRDSPPGLFLGPMNSPDMTQKEEGPKPVVSECISPDKYKIKKEKKEKKKKKKVVNVVVFDEDGSTGTVLTKTISCGQSGLPNHVEIFPNQEARENGDGGKLAQTLDESFDGSDKESKKKSSASFGSNSQISMVSGNSSRHSNASAVSYQGDCDSCHSMECAGHPSKVHDTMIQSGLSPSQESAFDLSSSSQSSKQDSLKTDGSSCVQILFEKDIQCRKLEDMLQQEVEMSATLRAEIVELKQQHTARLEKEQAKVQSLQKENEILKQELRKYIGAVQSLKTENAKIEEVAQQSELSTDQNDEAAVFEEKLVQVAEMHGELLEFNEQLHRQLKAKDDVLKQLKDIVVAFRGPLAFDRHVSDDSGKEFDSTCLKNPLINIWIPSVFIRGSATNTFHVYQVYIQIQDVEWNLFRRYSQFFDTHTRLKKVYPIAGNFEFPPKKTIGRNESRLLETRRKTFQTYLRNVVNLMLEKNQDLAANVSKEKLISYLPILSDKNEEGNKKGQKVKHNLAAVIPVAIPEEVVTDEPD